MKPHKYRRKGKITTREQKISLKNAKSHEGIVKDFYSTDLLIKELGTKLTFSDSEKTTAQKFFRDINYYRFSIFPKLLPHQSTSKKYSFTDALNLYSFDEFIKSNLYDFTSYLENKWKGSLINYLGNNYSNPRFYMGQCYLDLDLYQNKKWGKDVILQIEKRIQESNSLPIQHHKNNKNSYIPLWVIIEELTFGEFETFMTQLNQPLLQNYTKSIYNNPKYIKAFNGWVSLIRLLRNKISHHSRLYGGNFTKPPKILKDDEKSFFPELKKNSKLRNQLFASLYVLHKFLLFENPRITSQWNTFLIELEKNISTFDSILDIETQMGFPENWKELLTIR